MRRSTSLAVVLILAFAMPAQAGTRGDRVTGDFAYDLFGNAYMVSIGAHAAPVPTGVVQFYGPFGNETGGSVACVSIEDQDAWIAGPLTNPSPGMAVFEGFLVRVHDAGTPGTAGDMATMLFYWQLDDAMKACQKTTTQIDRLFLVPLTDGNVTIH